MKEIIERLEDEVKMIKRTSNSFSQNLLADDICAVLTELEKHRCHKVEELDSLMEQHRILYNKHLEKMNELILLEDEICKIATLISNFDQQTESE